MARINVNPDFSIDTSGIQETLDALNRQHAKTTQRLDREYFAKEELIEDNRRLARKEAVRHFGGGLVAGGINVANKLITSANKNKANHIYNTAVKRYEDQFDKFRRLPLQEKMKFLEDGNFDFVNDQFFKQLGDMGDAPHGIDVNAYKDKWNDFFVKNVRNVQFDVFQKTQAENEETVGALRSEQRNRMIADPYNQQWYNGAYEKSFGDSVAGIAVSTEETKEQMLYDKNYGLALGYHRAKDLVSMSKLLASDEAKKALGDDYLQLVRMRDKLAKDLIPKGGQKVAGLTFGLKSLAKDLDLQDFMTVGHTSGFGDYANQFNNNIIDFAENADIEGQKVIRLDNLAATLPAGMDAIKVKKIEVATREASEKMIESFKNDPVQFVLKTTGNRDVQQRAAIAERTGRWLTNSEVHQIGFALDEAMKQGLVQHALLQESTIQQYGGGDLGKKIVDEVYLRAKEIKAFKSEGGKLMIDLMSVNTQLETLGNLPLPEAHEYIAKGVRIPNYDGMGEVAAQVFMEQ